MPDRARTDSLLAEVRDMFSATYLTGGLCQGTFSPDVIFRYLLDELYITCERFAAAYLNSSPRDCQYGQSG